jgi:hypothetical protein
VRRCYCAECEKLDRVRLQGIAGTYQMQLVECQAERLAPAPPAPAPIASADDLPLFIGSLEPTLF